MKGRVALVTGSSRGIGKDIALRLAEVVGGVAVHYHRHGKAALDVVAAIEHKGKSGIAIQADLTKNEGASFLIREAIKKFGRVDILVNNFGPILVKPWENVTPEEWEYIWRGNLQSAVFCTKTVLPDMRRRNWGRIVNIGYSRAEQLVAFPTITAYAAAKTGLLILTRTVAAAEISSGITVNMVSPGLIEGGVLPQDKKGTLGRLGRHRDVSSAVLFLASQEADSITGTNIIVAGGWKI